MQIRETNGKSLPLSIFKNLDLYK